MKLLSKSSMASITNTAISLNPARQNGIISKLVSIIFVVTLLHSNSNHNFASGEEQYLNIQSLGRFANLGDIYDERTDQFRDSNLLYKPTVQFIENVDVLPILTTNKSSVTTDAALTTTYEDKFRLLNIDSNTAINFLSGLLEVEGSSRFLKDEETTLKEVTGVFLLKWRTVKESLQIFYTGMKERMNRDLLSQNVFVGTHVVTGITFGANFAFSFKSASTNTKLNLTTNRKTYLKNLLQNEFNSFQAGEFQSQNESNDDLLLSAFSMSIQADIAPVIQNPASDSPSKTHGQRVQEIISQVPSLLAGTIGGKGVPVEYTLTPISVLRGYLNITVASDTRPSTQKLNYWILKDIVRMFDDILIVEQELNDLEEALESQPLCLHLETLQKFTNLSRNFLSSKTKFASDIKETVVDVRSGVKSNSALSTVTEEYSNTEFHPEAVHRKINTEFLKALEKIKLLQIFQEANATNSNIKYFGAENNLQQKIFHPNTLANTIYILFQNSESIKSNPELWKESLNAVLSVLNKPYNRLFIVDCDFLFYECKSLNRTLPLIQQVIGGKISIQDVNLKLKLDQDRDLKPTLKMKAIGRFAGVGELYDATSDQFLENSVLSQSSIVKNVTSDKTRNKIGIVTLEIPSESYESKFEALGIDTEQQFSILTRLFEFTRSGQYFAEPSNQDLAGNLNTTLRTRSLLQTIYYTEEVLNVYDPIFAEHFAKAVRNHGLVKATHFVKELQWGLSTILFVEYRQESSNGFTTKDEIDTKTTSGEKFQPEFSMYFQALKKLIINIGNNQSAIVSLDELQDFQGPGGKIQIKVMSDLQLEDAKPIIFKTTEEFANFLNEVYIPNIADPKPVPISYLLYPIENLEKELFILFPDAQPIKQFNYNPVSSVPKNSGKFVAIFEQINSARNQIHQFALEIQESVACATDQDLLAIKEIKAEFTKAMETFQETFKQTVLKIKSFPQNASDTELTSIASDLFQRFNISIGPDGRYTELISKMSPLIEKLRFYRRLKMDGDSTIKYLGRESEGISFNQIFEERTNTFLTIYLLYYKHAWTKDTENISKWLRCSQTFFGPLNNQLNRNTSRFYVVDCDFDHPYCSNMTGPTIHEYKNGKLVTTNFIQSTEEEEADAQMRIHDIQNAAAENSNSIDSIRSGKTLQCDFWNKLMSHDSVVQLGCGGIIPLPPKGSSTWLDYKSHQAYKNNEQCLWTFNNTNNGKHTGIKVKITLLCEGFGDAGDVLSVLQWTPWDSNPLTSHELKSQGEDYASKMWIDGLYLSFISNGFSVGKGFKIRIDGVGIYANRNNALKFSSSATQGRETYGPYTKGSIVSIVVNPQKIATTTTTVLTIDSLDSKTLGSCDHQDSLDLYEGGIGVKGVPSRIARLCGNITLPIAFATEFPIVALFFTDKSTTGRGFGISWQ